MYTVSGIITAVSERTLCCNQGWLYRIVHIGIGAACLLVVGVTVIIKEKTLVEFVLKQWLGVKKKKKE
jgi:oligosaccharide translocation protein RFT1